MFSKVAAPKLCRMIGKSLNGSHRSYKFYTKINISTKCKMQNGFMRRKGIGKKGLV